ncbi:MAG: PIG-L family deacetylase [Flavobacteriales bacterium]
MFRILTRAFLVFLFFLFFLPISSIAQHSYRFPQASSDILHDLELAQHTGRVLYLAAHPDDENTELIAHLSRAEHIHTAYLSLTRGGGGQNLLGPEQGELLSVLRTQELLEARRIDGGKQFFTRARDFGYSKRAKESFRFWGRKKILKDVVRVIRRFRPDVIITRFPKGGYEGAHGHHTASAAIAEEAFSKASDPQTFPEQAEELGTWQPKRLLYNTSTWWDKKLPDKVDQEEKLFRVDVGKYDPYTGLSYTEIGAKAQSMHKCQGFGVEKERGRKWEYLRVLKDRTDTEQGPDSIMDGIPNTPSRYKGGKAVGTLLHKARKEFEPSRPGEVVPTLIKAYKALSKVQNERWRRKQKERLKQLILACSGTYIEASTQSPSACPGDSFRTKVEFTHRSEIPIKVHKVRIGDRDSLWNLHPEENIPAFFKMTATVPEEARISTHHWLQNPPQKGVYLPPDHKPGSIVRAEPPAAIHARLDLKVKDLKLPVRIPVEHKHRSRVRGGVYEPFRVLPPVTANSSGKAQVFPDASSRKVEVSYRGHRKGVEAKAFLQVPEGWEVKPSVKELRFDKKGAQKKVTFTVQPPSDPSRGELIPYVKVDGQRYQKREDRIAYDHITPQLVIRRSGVKAAQLGIGERKGKIGYIMGPGDEVPEALRQMGYSVELLPADELEGRSLQDYDVLITGIRAFNVNESLRYNNEELFQYVKEGGHLIIQYNKDEEALVTERIAPYTLVPSDDHRVTEEKATTKLLKPEHPVFNAPNKLDSTAFQGWVQERGLYFAKEWGKPFTPLISWHDAGEKPKKGGLLIAEHGKGSVVYTGIAFFRQLPAGVPGAYLLFDNLVQYGIGPGKP